MAQVLTHQLGGTSSQQRSSPPHDQLAHSLQPDLPKRGQMSASADTPAATRTKPPKPARTLHDQGRTGEGRDHRGHHPIVDRPWGRRRPHLRPGQGAGLTAVASPARHTAHSAFVLHPRGDRARTRGQWTMPWGSMTNFFAAPLSKSAYPCGASSRLITVAFTALAICALPDRIMFITCRL